VSFTQGKHCRGSRPLWYLITESNLNKDGPSDEVPRKSWIKACVGSRNRIPNVPGVSCAGAWTLAPAQPHPRFRFRLSSHRGPRE
jgi:hypothetical protein